jgi:hypothetical protein
MSLAIIQMEIQKHQTKIQSLGSEIMRTQAELEEMYREETRSGIRLGSDCLQQQINRNQSEIASLQRKIDELIEQAKSEEANSGTDHELNPLEALGLSALMKADGKMTDEQFNAMLEEVRRAMAKA